MQGADQGTAAELSGEGLRIAIVRARFNEPITLALAEHCLAELLALGVQARDIEHLTVPGALEIPVALKALADAGDCDAMIALGCVIRGETYHFELVANESAAGITRVALDSGLPVVFGRDDVTYIKCSDEHGVIEDPNGVLAINEKLRLVPGHCDPTCNIHDWYVGVRNGKVETLWPVSARGMAY